VINGTFSTWAPVKSGVPQGSVLGPILFLLFVNDMPQVLAYSKLSSMFADDSKCYKIIKSLADTAILQNDLTSLYSWSTVNELRFQ
jgi:mannose/fructose/N-acetylgalactosamine-specific phosphotransferase system component IID